MKQQTKNNAIDIVKETNSLKDDISEIKVVIEVLKRQIAELEKKHADKDEIQKLALADARELFEMRHNR